MHGDPGRLDHDRVAALVVLGAERTVDDDPACGFRKLVDIAERAIAQPFSDPTTTVMVLDRLHDCLRQLATRAFPSGRHADATGTVRLLERVMSWEGHIRLTFDELRLAGARSPQVPRRIRAALLDLKAVTPARRHPALDRQLRLLDAGVHRAYEDDDDLVAVLVPDHQGIGSGADLGAALPRPRPATGASVSRVDASQT